MDAAVSSLQVSAFTFPTDGLESDGTVEWNSTTLLLVRVTAQGVTGIGYSYADVAAAHLVDSLLRRCVVGCDVIANGRVWVNMRRAVRNAGRPGIASYAISAVDNAMWDLKARLLGLPLFRLLGEVREEIPAYGSGGFTSYTDEQLRTQFERWDHEGIRNMKMKIGRDPARDPQRVRVARDAMGDGQLFVDANGAFHPAEALAMAEWLAPLNVTWFEEPVSSDDLAGLRLVRERLPAGMRVAAGEYGYDSWYFRRMLEAGAVDVLQADATRCCGITGFREGAALAAAYNTPLSAHTSPSLHAHACCAVAPAINVEYFHDHVRIEGKVFDGAVRARHGMLRPDAARPGLGLEWKSEDAAPFEVFRSREEA